MVDVGLGVVKLCASAPCSTGAMPMDVDWLLPLGVAEADLRDRFKISNISLLSDGGLVIGWLTLLSSSFVA